MITNSSHKVKRPVFAGQRVRDADSPTKFAEAMLGKELPSRRLQQYLAHGQQVATYISLLRVYDGQAVYLFNSGFKGLQTALRRFCVSMGYGMTRAGSTATSTTSSFTTFWRMIRYVYFSRRDPNDGKNAVADRQRGVLHHHRLKLLNRRLKVPKDFFVGSLPPMCVVTCTFSLLHT